MKLKLVSHWRLWWRRWSTWGSAFNSALVTALLAKSGVLFSFVPFLYFIPQGARGFAAGALAALLFFLIFIAPVLLVNLRQPGLAEKRDAGC